MVVHWIFAALCLGASLAAAGPASPPRGPAAQDAAGDWEAVMASPRRPWIFTVHLERSGAAWKGSMSAPGWPEFPLHDIRVDSARVHFRCPPELDSLAFEGTLAEGRIEGHVREPGGPTPTRLTRVVPMRPPADRIEAWRQDLDHALTRVLEYDRSFGPRAREEFRAAIARLDSEIPRRSDAEILVALSRAVALAGNAHTRLRLDPTRGGTFATELPLRMWWFSDGPHVIRAAPQVRRALRCRVVAIDGHDIADARDQVSRLFAGNASWTAYLAPLYLASPDVLHGLGLIRSAGAATFTLEDTAGRRFDLVVRAQPVDRDHMADESWQELSPATATGVPPWPTALDGAGRVPLYLRHPDRPYWFEFLPESGLLYFQFNRSGDAREGPTFREFGDSLLAFAGRRALRGLVVDLRLNSGGNLEVARDFMKGLAGAAKLDGSDRLFVVTGNCTFSAGLYHAAQLRQFTKATFVGEPVGDHLDYWAEGGRIVLPNSGAAIHYSNGFHRYSTSDYPGHRPYYEELRVESLGPDVPAPLSSADYFAGRDPALAAIEARLRD